MMAVLIAAKRLLSVHGCQIELCPNCSESNG